MQRRVRCAATRLSHALGLFRPVPDLPGYLEAFCATCGAGVRVHTVTADVSIAVALEQACGRPAMPAPPSDGRD